MIHKKLQVISFLILLFGMGAVVFWVFWPFMTLLAMAGIFAILFHPVFMWINAKLKSPSVSAGATLVLIVLMFLVPLLIFGQVLFNEIYGVYDSVRGGGLVLQKSDIVANLPVQVQDIVTSMSQDLNTVLTRFSSTAFKTVSNVVSNVAGFVLSLVVGLFTLFFLLRDGARIKEVFMELSPIATKQENILIERVVGAINGVVKGSFLVALIQGMIATLGFLLFGVPQPLLWGMFTVMAALIPTVGTTLSLVPAVVYLFITGHTGAAIGMAIWGMLAVGLIDNVLSPRLIGERIKLHPLLVLFSVIGGLQLFGFLGFLLGPILLAMFMSMIDIYRSDFKQYLEQK